MRLWQKVKENNMSEKQKPKVKLVGTDGNAFAILGKCIRALRQAGYSSDEIAKFKKEATSSDYDHLLATCMEWCNVE